MNGLRRTPFRIFLFGLLLSLFACMPQQQAPRGDLSAGGQTPDGGGGNGAATEVLAGFNGETRNFIEAGGVRSFDVQTLNIGTADSILVMGLAVQARIQALPVTSKVCVLAEFKFGSETRVLALSALRRRTVLATQTTAQGLVTTVSYSWLIFPGDQARNQADCLTSGLVATKNTLYGAATPLRFSLPTLCSDCSNAPTSEGLRAFLDSGSELPDLSLLALKLRIDLTGASTSTGLTCSSNSACAQIGFNCCLEGQCVKDGAERPGIDTSTNEYALAIQDVLNNPTRFKIYPQIFYVCPTTTPTTPGGSDATDPNFAAQKRFNEMRDLFECVNPQFDEMGYCSLSFPNASTRIRSENLADRIFRANLDDNNFSWTGNALNINSIFAFRYGEQILYQEGLTGLDTPVLPGSHILSGGGNGTLQLAQGVEVIKRLASNAPDDTLILKYKIDATCVRLSSQLARCSKTYVQGRVSTPPRPSDHPTSNFFALPEYADLVAFDPIVRIGDTIISRGDSTWRPQGQGIFFTMPVTANQVVSITYYATPNAERNINLDTLTQSRTTAQNRINQLCGCGVVGTTNCNLAPVTVTSGTTSTITDYSCVYPQPPQAEPPLQQVIFVSGKTVPSRYYDVNGAVWDGDTGTTAPAQEGLEFNYTNNDPLRPNNVSQYVGFHEIYGSFTKTAAAPKPPRLVNVKKDRVYDIFVDAGGFASCENCGNDPYNPVLRLFPQNFSSRAGGYVPDLVNTSRVRNTGSYRADDLLFGRACFVPATMLPWSHASASTVGEQRQRRLAAQHAMFANGYQRDWFGFDYGSLIGSFDGVTWFSIGNQRRIKASSSRLFLAVNAFFGDRTLDNNFKVVVSESLSAVNSGSTVEHDSESDGAQCQRAHFCSTDDDCVNQLGYDYTCQTVTGLTTPWPSFDASGNELVGSQLRPLAALVGGTNGQARRCVYRGRGTPCEPNLNALTQSFNGSIGVGLSACSPNNYCAAVDGQARFNTAIARFGSSPAAQNLLGTLGTRDTVGQGARVIGRPLNYYGTQALSQLAPTSFALNANLTLADYLKNSVKVKALCLPGRDVTGSSTYAEAHSRTPPANDLEAADRILGVGPTAKLSSSSTLDAKLLAMCPATQAGTFVHHSPTASLTNATLREQTIRQNTSTTLLNLTEYASLNLFNTNNGSAATAIGLQRNACLRNAGATCLSDFECAPNEFISTKMRTLSSWGGFANNPAEQAHWREDLVCGNPEPAKLINGTDNPLFDIKANRCCREIAKTIQTFTQKDGEASFFNCIGSSIPIAGVNIPANSSQRNLRNNLAVDVATCAPPEAGKTPALFTPTTRTGGTPMSAERILRQYETLDKINSRMCCTGSWVRSFASENGGGYRWGQNRTQNVDRASFAAWVWYHDQKFTTILETNEAEPMACAADNFGTLACEIRNLNDTQVREYLSWVALLELVGIPQAMITIPTQNNRLARLVDESNQTSLESVNSPISKTLIKPSASEIVPDITDSAEGYISGTSYSKLDIGNGKLKRVFSESEFNCCIGAGGTLPQNANANMCCTGTATNDGDNGARCCLDDFSDVTLYLNRYVSSEGRGLPQSSYDARSGYIKDPGQVLALARSKNLCCSGNIVAGSIVGDYFIPLQGGNRLPQAKSRRFAYRKDALDNNSETGPIGDIYDAGLRWNTHYYCAPPDYVPPGQ